MAILAGDSTAVAKKVALIDDRQRHYFERAHLIEAAKLLRNADPDLGMYL